MSDHHGIPEIPGVDTLDLIEGILDKLGIEEHTDEDCLVSEVLHNTTGKPVVVSGESVFILDLDAEAWTRYLISAGARRRILAGNPGEITLGSPNGGDTESE